MKTMSNADYASVLRLLGALSHRKGTTLREREDARKATLLLKKLNRNESRLH